MMKECSTLPSAAIHVYPNTSTVLKERQPSEWSGMLIVWQIQNTNVYSRLIEKFIIASRDRLHRFELVGTVVVVFRTVRWYKQWHVDSTTHILSINIPLESYSLNLSVIINMTNDTLLNKHFKWIQGNMNKRWSLIKKYFTRTQTNIYMYIVKLVFLEND